MSHRDSNQPPRPQTPSTPVGARGRSHARDGRLEERRSEGDVHGLSAADSASDLTPPRSLARTYLAAERRAFSDVDVPDATSTASSSADADAHISSTDPTPEPERHLQALLRHLPTHAPSAGFSRRVLAAAGIRGGETSPAVAAWLDTARGLGRSLTAAAIVVVGCAVGILGTLFGSAVTAFGFAGSAVWSSRTALDSWRAVGEVLDVVWTAAETGRRALLATSSLPLTGLLLVCALTSTVGFVTLVWLQRRGADGIGEEMPEGAR